MSKGVQKTTPPSTAVAAKRSLPAKVRSGSVGALATLRKLELTKGLPPATIIYGGAAGVLFALALIFLVAGHWMNGLLTMLPAMSFLGFAVHLLKHGQ